MARASESAERRAEAKRRIAELRAQLRAALAAKKARLREIVKMIHAERIALRDRLRDERRTKLAEIREWERAERKKARAQWAARTQEVRQQANGELARVRAELAAERAHAAEARRITRDARARAATHAATAQSDDVVRAIVPRELVPLFDRLKRAVRGSSNESRAEAFLRLAAERPDEVFALVEPQLSKLLDDIVSALKHARKFEGARVPRVKPANGNGLTGGGLLPTEEQRLLERRAKQRSREDVKGQGLDTTGVAKLIRADILAAVKGHTLPNAKYSVRTDKYAMGSSIDVVVSDLPFPVLNPDAFVVDPGANFVHFDHERFTSRFTASAREVEEKLNAIIDAYHWDKSDPVTDYYNERFARDVRLTEREAVWKSIVEAKLAEARTWERGS